MVSGYGCFEQVLNPREDMRYYMCDFRSRPNRDCDTISAAKVKECQNVLSVMIIWCTDGTKFVA